MIALFVLKDLLVAYLSLVILRNAVQYTYDP